MNILYYYTTDKQRAAGPLPLQEIHDLIEGGKLPASTTVCYSSMGPWVAPKDIQQGLFSSLMSKGTVAGVVQLVGAVLLAFALYNAGLLILTAVTDPALAIHDIGSVGDQFIRALGAFVVAEILIRLRQIMVHLKTAP